MTYGLMVIAINLGYLLFAIAAGVFLAKFLRRFSFFHRVPGILLSTLLILAIALAPFYDLLIQKGIKTYYEVFDKTYAKIYAYPEKDSEGRIESLGVDKEVSRTTSLYLSTLKDLKDFKKDYMIRDFAEYYFYDSFKKLNDKIEINYKKDMGYIRVYLNIPSVKYDKISATKDFKARYQVLTQVKKYYFFTKKIVFFWDKKKNKLLAKGLEIDFPVKKEESKFRYKFLHLHGANGIGISILRLRNHDIIFEKLFHFSRNFSKIQKRIIK